MRSPLPSLRTPFLSALSAVVLASSLGANCGSKTNSSTGSLAPDPTAAGPHATTSSEYRFAPELDETVFADYATEIWAEVYRPQDWTHTNGAKHPLILFLHGNHPTCGSMTEPYVDDSCQYTFIGSCPSGNRVVPNHRGYDYLAHRLASWGYVVVSINANRGITCGKPKDESDTEDSGLILARGRLVLKHLALLSQWNREGGTPSSIGVDFKNQLDLQQVGLMGHSRGGEGMRAAYQLYRDSGSRWPAIIGTPINVQGIFEIAPVDQHSERTLDAEGTAWNVLLPLCDGDIENLQGLRPFDRMADDFNEYPPRPKSIFAVWGANHNFYNTEWQTSDSPGCTGTTPLWETETDGEDGPTRQRQTAIYSVLGFFRAHVGAEKDSLFARNFDPAFPQAEWFEETARVDRTFKPSPNKNYFLPLENFETIPGTFGGDLTARPVSVIEHEPTLKSANLTWTESKRENPPFFFNEWDPAVASLDLRKFESLDFRVSRAANGTLNPTFEDTDFSVQLVGLDGNLGPAVSVVNYASILGPVGIPEHPHFPLQSVRIPLADLGDFTAARGVRFTFDRSSTGDLFLADIGLSAVGSAPGEKNPPVAYIGSALSSAPRNQAPTRVKGDSVRVELLLSEPFLVRDALPELFVDGKSLAVGYVSESGDLGTVVFRVSTKRLKELPGEFEVSLGFRESPTQHARKLGRMKKADWIRVGNP